MNERVGDEVETVVEAVAGLGEVAILAAFCTVVKLHIVPVVVPNSLTLSMRQ